jgi:ATP-dependent helicase HrpB
MDSWRKEMSGCRDLRPDRSACQPGWFVPLEADTFLAMPDLPIESVVPALRDALRAGRGAVLQAPPGAGKTTRVPLALLDEPWLAGSRMVMLEPRRLAARAAAARMASTLGERVGDTVGYRVRMDTRVGPRTRIEVVTEGVLTRMLQSDPALEGVGLVIFDEFHERNLHGDVGLALALQCRALLRDELRLLVMSATLQGEPVAALLGGCPVITSEGRAHPVDTRYLPRAGDGPMEALAARAVHRALEADEGDVLVFLPGAGEIRRTEEMLRGELPEGVRLAPLHGTLAQEAQDAAIAPSSPAERKVVLSTSIAETSLTIEGVRVVVDAGWMRVPRFSPRSGMTRLHTARVTRASADQRRGRAGRLGPGVCYRLWTEGEHAALLAHGTPEILEADLAPLALELAVWGVADPVELAWLDPPPAAAFAQARELLTQLGALDPGGAVTPHGRHMARLGLHPRLAHMTLRAKEMGCGGLACELAALMGGRDVLRAGPDGADADLRLRVEAMRGGAIPPGSVADRDGLRRVAAEARQLARELGVRPGTGDVDRTGSLIALAYPDRVAQARPGAGSRYLLRNGSGAALGAGQSLAGAPYLATAELGGRGGESRIFLAAPLEPAEILELFGDQVWREEVIAWDDAAGAVAALRRERLGALALREGGLPEPDPEQVSAALLEGVRRRGLRLLDWSKDALQLRERLVFLHAMAPEAWPDASEPALLETLGEWLAPHVYGLRSAEHLGRVDAGAALRASLDRAAARRLDELAPTHVEVPSGSRIAIDYGDPAAPVLAVRLQEVFGLVETPRVGGGRVPLTLHLLSPARRPVQVTRDLASFWRTGYFAVRKELKGRYPKHYWPDDPLQAEPTHRVRPR